MMDTAAGGANTSIGEFGWTGALGTWTSIDPSEGVSVVYMHQTSPNMEIYYHLRVRAAAYGGLK
jgi:CubicO group peptidase (beta-lactamase class C family)